MSLSLCSRLSTGVRVSTTTALRGASAVTARSRPVRPSMRFTSTLVFPEDGSDRSPLDRIQQISQKGRKYPLPDVGVSAMAMYVPAMRVRLEEWCKWTGNQWPKVRSVVGRSFRMPSRNEDIYTMAANAALRLIIQNDIDPREIGFLGFGTESSRDNATGAIIVAGMLNRGLSSLGRPTLRRNVEVPEFKHACLGGIYALKAASRFVSTDRRGRKALVVCGDIAEYERGSTGEQTQGAGTVAMLVERDPKLFTIDLDHVGSSSAYRGPDFRKPHSRPASFYSESVHQTLRPRDFPVFTGQYSQFCYTDAVAHAVEDMLDQLDTSAGRYYRKEVNTLFFHRPFHMMPIQALSFMYIRGMARGTHWHHELRELCTEAKVSYTDVLAEAKATPDLYDELIHLEEVKDLYPATRGCARALMKKPEFTHLLEQKMSLGSDITADFGNMYSASLPAWIAAAFDDAVTKRLNITNQPMVCIGYGSGDAAEAFQISPVQGWEAAASRIGAQRALLGNVVDLTKEQYEAVHDCEVNSPHYISAPPRNQFIIHRTGDRMEPTFQDLGVEYYEYIGDNGEPLPYKDGRPAHPRIVSAASLEATARK